MSIANQRGNGILKSGHCDMPVFIIGGSEICLHCLMRFGISLDVRDEVRLVGASACGHTHLDTIDAIAEDVVEEILSIQPDGKYRLIGFQTEGLVAYETATQLVAQDKEIAFVGMIDTRAVYSKGNNELRSRNTCVFCRTTLAIDLPAARHALIVDRFCYSLYPTPFQSEVFALSAESAEVIAQQWKSVMPIATPSVKVFPIFQQEKQPFSDALQDFGKVMSNAIEAAKSSVVHASETADSPLIALQAPPNRFCPIVFCVPGAGANITAFLELSSYINPDIAVYGVQPRGIDGESIPHRSVPLIAKSCLSAIKKLELQRDIHILGHSYGGIVAFDLTVKLCDEGQKVKSLTLLDSTPPSLWSVSDRRWSRAEVIMQMVQSIELLIEDSLGINLSDLAGNSEEYQLRLLHGRLIARRILPRSSSWMVLRGPMRNLNAALRTKYFPSGKFEGSACFFTSESRLQLNDSHMHYNIDWWSHWRTILPNVMHLAAKGNHATMLKGINAQRLAERLPFNRRSNLFPY